jgi:hypothetical protein
VADHPKSGDFGYKISQARSACRPRNVDDSLCESPANLRENWPRASYVMSDPAPPSIRFTLAGLFELIAGIGLFLALVTQLEWVGFVMAVVGFLTIAAAQHVASAGERGQAVTTVWGCFLALVMLLLVVALLFPVVHSARESGRRAVCSNNIHQLALAFHAYHNDHGHFPPPYVADAAGKPMHSWRVLILPYLERPDLYNAYNLNEPWNGPNNSKLAAIMLSVFRCPADPKMPAEMTSYFCIVGPGRMKEGHQELKMSDVTDGPDNTIMLVESSSARVNWLEPRDLAVEDVLAGKNTVETPCPCSRHGGSDHGMWRGEPYLFNAAMFDGAATALPAKLDAETLKALLTIDGGEPTGADRGNFDVYREHLWPGFWVLLAAEIVFVALAVVRRVRIGRRMRSEVQHG